MRKSTCAVFLFVSLIGITSASAPLAAPANAPRPELAQPSTAVDRPGSSPSRGVVQANDERKPEQSEAKTLSRDFSSPKPVQIYWFFGGR